MSISKASKWVLSGDFLYNKRLSILIWFGFVFIATLQTFFVYKEINNYKIYRSVFLHLIENKNLYLLYPAEYGDVNLYGPVFSALIAPFALLPDTMGVVCWIFFNATFLYIAIRRLPIPAIWQYAILILCSNELMNNAGWCQINPFIAGCIILGFVFTNKGKDAWALFFILLATFIKIYGIVGLAFFFFSKNKWQYIGWFIVWSIVFFCLPMLYANPSFVITSYSDWYHALVIKSSLNLRTVAEGNTQDICVMGMIRRIFNLPHFNNMLVLIPAIILFCTQYIHLKHFEDVRYRLYLLCSVLIFTVIFSTGSEAPTYIIAMPAICLWWLMQPPSQWVNGVFIFATIVTNFGYSDIFSPYFRNYIVRPYSLRALPCFIIWLIIIYQIYSKQFLVVNLNRKRKANNES
ncbi:MAG: DUF2029 domain-containing protein [Sphingobacteriales bacterium]|nr:DUF2029 domain-containing protein [Sphingobacteriales bacterium]